MSLGEDWSARPPTQTNKDGYRVVGHNFLWLGVSKCLPPIQVLQLLTTKSYLILCGVHTGKAAAAPEDGLPPCSFAHALPGLRCKVALPMVACRPPACSAGAEVVLGHLTMLSPWGGELLFLQNVGRVLFGFCFFCVLTELPGFSLTN